MTHIPYQLADVPDGWTGWIAGRIVPPAPLVAPITLRACVYYQVLGNPGGGPVGNQREGVELTIEDDTGHAIVELRDQFVEIDYDWDETKATPEERVRIAAFLSRHGLKDARNLREGVLAPGEHVVVHGRMMREPDHDPRRVRGYRDALPTRVRVSGGARVQLFVSEVAAAD